jgi:hypothetical protein
MLPEAILTPCFQHTQFVTAEVSDGFLQFAGEKLFVGAHTEQDFFAEAKHISGHCRGGWFQFHL